jgi:hypothetical protein
MKRVPIEDFTINGWTDTNAADAASRRYAEELEAGNILFFPRFPFDFPEEDRAFLRGVRQSSASYHKNIAYRPQRDKVTGIERGTPYRDRLLTVLRRFSRGNVDLVSRLLPLYARTWKVDYASFRPIQEKGRQLSQKARNDLIHVDAFPTRPTNGNRILRVFSNISPDIPRVWVTTDPFDVIAPQYADEAGLPSIAGRARRRRSPSPLARFAAKNLGLHKLTRSHYDEFMLGFHDFLKGNQSFQQGCKKYQWEFPPLSTWMCYLDTVPHAVVSGQYALEQTFFIARDAMVAPDKAPVSVLERLAGVKLTN